GYVFQSYHLIPTLTAVENVAVPLEIVGAPDALGRARSLLADVGLGDRMHHYPVQLSGGEQQRVALARAVAPDPGLLLADEPTGNLDSATGVQIIELLLGLNRRRGSTLVLVTHDEALAGRARRPVWLRAGGPRRSRRAAARRPGPQRRVVKLGFAVRMAWRETRGAGRHFAVLFGCVALGVAALVSVGTFAANLDRTLTREARALTGGDVELRSAQPLDPTALGALGEL